MNNHQAQMFYNPTEIHDDNYENLHQKLQQQQISCSRVESCCECKTEY